MKAKNDHTSCPSQVSSAMPTTILKSSDWLMMSWQAINQSCIRNMARNMAKSQALSHYQTLLRKISYIV